MPTWDPELYLRFERERTLPCRDLIARLATAAPRSIVDLGCGTGTSTALLRERWPGARVTGIDNATEMIATARAGPVGADWLVDDLRTWRAPAPYDLVFSNAALQWVPNHPELFLRLLNQVGAGGALAVQMPINFDSLPHRSIHEVTASPSWRARWGPGLEGARVESPGFYYDLFAPRSASVDLWQTEYVHVVPDAGSILEWVKGTTLRPYLDSLTSADERTRFLGEIGQRIMDAYPPRLDGWVLFPFRRLFLIAHR